MRREISEGAGVALRRVHHGQRVARAEDGPLDPDALFSALLKGLDQRSSDIHDWGRVADRRPAFESVVDAVTWVPPTYSPARA